MASDGYSVTPTLVSVAISKLEGTLVRGGMFYDVMFNLLGSGVVSKCLSLW